MHYEGLHGHQSMPMGQYYEGIHMEVTETMERSRRFYENEVAPMIHRQFGDYENRIAVGIAGEGSDCFGFDDLISRDHDFGTGVCLWIAETDFPVFGYRLSIAYNELADRFADAYITDRIRERRGVLGIHAFYSDILSIDCDTEHCTMPDEAWRKLDHNCLATAVNGAVFRDDLGNFSAFRQLLLDYYPERIWRERIADGLHFFSQCLQVNFARCMTRGDIVAAQLCRAKGLEAAMQLFFLLHRKYPPYYKWTFRALEDMDKNGMFSTQVRTLAGAACDPRSWEKHPYHPDTVNLADGVVAAAEEIAAGIVRMLQQRGFTKRSDPYLESYVSEIIAGAEG